MWAEIIDKYCDIYFNYRKINKYILKKIYNYQYNKKGEVPLDKNNMNLT